MPNLSGLLIFSVVRFFLDCAAEMSANWQHWCA
jgi:hypothetical protein